ncbi:unnamed protein product [Pleuronectes platessa]|uniref:Uncharacterized protein n=1 Tax=Pleuronectes platessa TaxID=8262 RepID=A0A9N7UFP0_PLEPL|nr:unnamed protein product [Pleuronectes platessa]
MATKDTKGERKMNSSHRPDILRRGYTDKDTGEFFVIRADPGLIYGAEFLSNILPLHHLSPNKLTSAAKVANNQFAMSQEVELIFDWPGFWWLVSPLCAEVSLCKTLNP